MTAIVFNHQKTKKPLWLGDGSPALEEGKGEVEDYMQSDEGLEAENSSSSEDIQPLQDCTNKTKPGSQPSKPRCHFQSPSVQLDSSPDVSQSTYSNTSETALPSSEGPSMLQPTPYFSKSPYPCFSPQTGPHHPSKPQITPYAPVPEAATPYYPSPVAQPTYPCLLSPPTPYHSPIIPHPLPVYPPPQSPYPCYMPPFYPTTPPMPHYPSHTSHFPPTSRRLNHTSPISHENCSHGEDVDPDSDWVDFEEVFEDYDKGPPLKFSKKVVDTCYRTASSRSNLAV